MTLSQTLARTLLQADRPPVPADVLQLAKLHILDALGVGLAASRGPAGSVYHGALTRLQSQGAASVIGRRQTAAPADAALANGGLIHALEFDDTHMGSIVHGSAVLLPAALASAQANHSSGEALLTAYIDGWESLVRIGRAAPGAFQKQGFQITVTAGVFAAAQIACRLMNATVDDTVAAFGIALSQSSGVFEFLTNGSTVKSFHAGWAAHGGLIAAALAVSGITGPTTSFEGQHGLFKKFADSPAASERFRTEIATRDSVWHLRDAAFKFYPCCHYIHPFLTAIEQLEAKSIRAQDIEELTCFVPQGAAPIICNDWNRRLAPQSAHEMRYSLPIVIALRLIDGAINLQAFDNPASEAVQSFARKIKWQPLENDSFPDRFEAMIVAKLSDGSRHGIEIDDVRGGPRYPATPDSVLNKFRTNTSDRDSDAVEKLVEIVMTLEGQTMPALGAALMALEV